MAYFSEADSLKSFTVLGTDFRAWSSQWRVILVFPSEVSGKLDSSEHQNRLFFFFFPCLKLRKRSFFFALLLLFFSPGIFFPALPSASTFWYNKVHFCWIWILYLSFPLAWISNDINLSSVWSVSFLYLAYEEILSLMLLACEIHTANLC